jgi:hypothetical protein
MLMERIKNTTREAFDKQYIVPNRPVIVTDAMCNWDARTKWTPSYFSHTLGALKVLVYNDLFDLTNVTTLKKYIERNMNGEMANPSLEYVRWYSRQRDVDLCWSDVAFERLKGDWSTPYFLSQERYVIPRAMHGLPITPESSLFPYRGLFISGRGARTRLHRDPWTSCAILCQLFGRKQFVMYEPKQCIYLMHECDVVDITNPDVSKFTHFQHASASYCDVLNPGEIVFIPSGWLHHFACLTDSISITWNFVHESGFERLCAHLLERPQEPELDVIKFFLRDIVQPTMLASEIVGVLREHHRLPGT